MPKKQDVIRHRNRVICQEYKSKRFTTTQIAKYYNLTRQQVLRICKAGGVVRTQAEGNRAAAKLMPQHRVRRKPSLQI